MELIVSSDNVCTHSALLNERQNEPRHSPEEIEQRVNANLLRVKVNGEWHEVPMVELSDRLCESDHQMFRRYCD